MRLQKFLALSGIASRRKAEELIVAGHIKVNGEVVTELGTSVDPETDEVIYKNRAVRIRHNFTYIALYKPVDYVSSTSSLEGKSVMELVPRGKALNPVGRLDKDSSGLLLLTNDGEFAQKISHPSLPCEKEYFVLLDQPLQEIHRKRMEQGMILASKRLKPVKIYNMGGRNLKITMTQGVNRQIRRMFGKFGYRVDKLKRIRIGKLELAGLEIGQWREVTPEEII